MKYKNQFIGKMLTLGLIATWTMTLGTNQVFAASSAEVVGGKRDYNKKVVWDDPDKAPILRVTLEDGYKLKGKNETFEMELTNASWYEGRDTTLYISDSKGIAVYEASVYTRTDKLAEVTVQVPRELEEKATISIDIPLLIKVKEGVEDVSVAIRELDKEEGLIQNAVIPIANTNDKHMSWKVGDVPTIGESEAIAPIRFEETSAGTLGSREIDLTILLKNRYLRFEEPTYISKTENSDDIDYHLDVNDYIEYAGGFKSEGQPLRVSIAKDGKSMRVRMSGSVPNERGVIILKNFKVKSTDKDVTKENVVISLQSEELMTNNQDVVVACFDPSKGKTIPTAQQTEQPQVKEESEKKSDIPVKVQETNINFKVDTNYYTVNGKPYQMDGKTYIKEPGYTMVPIRYVAEALGVKEIKFKEGIVSFTYNNQEIVLTTGSTQTTVNSVIKMMQVPLELKDGRVYAPMGEIANLLGVDKTWDSHNQSACFMK